MEMNSFTVFFLFYKYYSSFRSIVTKFMVCFKVGFNELENSRMTPIISFKNLLRGLFVLIT